MKKELYILPLVCLALCFSLISPLIAQDNIQVDFASPATVPDFLNVCGDTDTEVVRVSVDGLDPAVRTGITATAHLFEGVEFVSFDIAGSSPTVSLVDDTDANNPIFSIVELDPFGTSFVDIAFTVRATCGYLDTISANNAASVLDTWEFTYDMGASLGLNEFDDNVEYRDAFAIPSFTISEVNTFGAARVGDCYSRDIVTTNSGLDGFVDTLVYTNLQGPGVYVESILVNGVPVTMNKVVNGTDTLITVLIDGVQFVNNTVGGGPGDGDVFLDPNETVTITENICVLDCFDSRASSHGVSWGCDGIFCNTTTVDAFADIGLGTANLLFNDAGSLPNINTGYCQNGQSTVTFTNDGLEVDPGFATMIDVTTGIGLGGAFELMNSGFEITAIRIAGVDIPVPETLVDLDSNALFTTDPDGVGGLTDFDGDGYFDDLPLNESIEISVFFNFDCSIAQDPGSDMTCANSFSTSFNARIDHTDACGDRIIRLETSYFRPSNTRSEVENFTDTDAFNLTDTFYVTHTQTRGVRFFEKSCSGGEQLLVTVVLPPGVSILDDATEVIRNEATSYPLISNTMSNDTAFLVFDASVLSFINGDYEVILGMLADCTAPLGPTNFPTEFAHYCPDCDCKHIWFCGDLDGPQLHSTDPPCPPVPCPIGLRTTEFDVNRTTFGYTDETWTTAYNPDSANTKVAISCDSVEMKILNVVGDTPVTDSLGMVITYNNVDGSLSTDETFLFGLGYLRIVSGGTEYNCTVDTSIVDVVSVDSIKTLTFDLDPCLTGLGITLSPGDTVEFRANFTLNPDGPYPAQFRRVQNLRGYGFARFDGVDESCDNFGDIITIAKNQTVFNIPSSSSFPEGCQETFLNYQLITVNNGFIDYFGNEYRQAIGVDSLIIQFDTTIFEAYDVFEPQVAFPGHPVHGNNYYAVPPFTDFPDGRYVVHFDTLAQVPALNNVSSYSFSFRIRTIPNCKTMFASSNANNTYNMDPEIFFIDRYYATDIGDGSCADVRNEALDNDIVYDEPPSFNFSYVSSPNYNLAADTAEWVVQHCNTSFTADAGLTWIAIEDSTNAIEVVSIEDISDPMNPVSLTFNNYGGIGSNTFAFAPGVTRGDGSTPISDVCNTIRIKAVVNICGVTDFHTKVGWNCVAYTDPLWNPEDNPPCDDLVLPLRVTTLDPFLDANIIEQPATNPEICDTSTIAILVRNTNQGNAYDVVTQLLLPFEGAEIVSGSVEFAYPSSAAFVPVATDPTFTGTSPRGRIFQYDNFAPLNAFLDGNGLPGFNPVSPTDSNEFVIRYRFVTDCEFTSGSILYYQLQGLKGCGDSTNFETGETLPIFINGADPGLSKIFDVRFEEGSVLNPGGSSTVVITATNLTTTPTDTTDKVMLSIPLNMEYQIGSSLVISPPTWTITEPSRDTVSGFEQLYWCMPAGLLQDDSLSFQITLNSPTFDCAIDSVDLGLITILQQDLTCAATMTTCNVDAVTSSNNGAMSSLAVNQQTLDVTLTGISSFCASSTEEQVTVDGIITNLGNDFMAPNFTVRYYHDQDNSGGLTPGDPELINFIETGPILSGAAQAFQHTFTVNSANVCSIIGLIDTVGLDLCDDAAFLIDDVQLLNAGADVLLCETTPTTVSANLGDASCAGMVGYTYQWFAVAPANIADLDDPTSATPTFSFNFDGVTEDTLQYYVETTRPGCFAVSRDTVQIILGAGVIVDLGNDITIPNGSSVILNANALGGTMPYTYSWAPAATLDDASASQPVATPIQDTTQYFVTVTTATGCTAIDSVRVIWDTATPCTIPLTSVTVSEATCGNMDGDITLHLGGLESGYQYDWTPDVGSVIGDGNQRANLPAGGYTVLITDLSDPTCNTSIDILLQNSDGPTATVDVTAADCGQANGTANLLPATFNYLWPDNSTANNRLDLAAGTYFVTLTDPADPACPNVVEVVIEEAVNLMATLTVVNTPDCGMSNGEVSINVTGGVGPYGFSWPGGTNTQSNISSGVYTVTITDNGAPGACSFEYTFALVDNVPGALINITDTTSVSCAGTSTGGITFDVTYDVAFVGPADTIITDGVISYDNMNLPAGDYCIIIEDANGCIAGQACFTIETPDPLLFWFTVTPACGSGGSVDLEVQGGTGPFIVDWGIIPGANDPEDIANLAPGAYPVTVTDANNCVLSDFTEIAPCGCDIPLTSATISEASCGNNDGAVTLHLGGLEGNYQYDWTPDLGTPIGDGNQRVNIPAGSYTVLITDLTDNTCTSTIDVLVQNSNGPMATLAVTAADCGQTNGTATLLPANFEYLWPDNTTASNRTDLAAGIYVVTITDPADPSCDNFIEVTIDENANLNATLNVVSLPDCGIANGSVSIDVTGGVGPYGFSWAGGTNTQNNLSSGVYTVTITDQGAPGTCEFEYVFALADNVAGAIITINDTADALCAADANGGLSFDVSFDVSFVGPADTIITDGTFNYENDMLPAGDYCILILDANGCIAGQECFTIEVPDPLFFWFTVTPACDNGGTVDLEIEGGTGPFVIDWLDVTGSDDPEDLADLAAGVYPLTVTDANNCTLSDFTEIEPCGCEPPMLNSVIVVEATCGNTDGSATVHMTDNDSLYTYTWLPDLGFSSSLGNSKVNLPAGGYTVTVASIADPTCFSEVQVLVTNSDGPEASVITTPATCQAADGTATLTPADYLYEWADGTEAAIRNDLMAGAYFVTLTDTINAPDCPNVMLFSIEEDNPLTAELVVNNEPDCGVSNGSVTINVNNGSGNYSFAWEDGLTSNLSTRTDLSSGVYNVTISDNGPLGCALEYNFILLDNVGTATLTILDTIDVSCADAADGGVLYDVNYLPAFNAPADTIISDGVNTYENGSLPVGDYCIYIVDAGGCLVAGNCFEVTEPDPMDLYIVIAPACDSLGCADVTVNGGTAPFNYDWEHLSGTNDPSSICQLTDSTYQITVTDANGCVISEEEVVVPACSDECEFFGGLDSLLVEAPNCQSRADICINFPLQEVLNLEILDNGIPYDMTVTGCDFDSLVVYAYSELFGQGDLGPYEVISWTVNDSTFSGEFMDIPALVDSMNTWDPMGNWSIASVGQFVTGGSASSTYSSILIDAINFGTVSELGVNFSAVPNGFQLLLEPGDHEVVIIDMSSGCSDTLSVTVTCADDYSVCVNGEGTFCVDESTLNLSGAVSSMVNICPELSDGSVDFVYDPANLCVDYTGVSFGADTTCIQFCDAAGICDTIQLIVTVDSCVDNTLHNVKDSIFINQTVVYCPDSTNLPGNIISIDNYCDDLSQGYVDFFIDPITNCVEYTGLDIGVDTACIVVCDDLGFCDTTLFCVAVIEFFGEPVVTPDTLCTPEGTPIVINALDNDTLYGGIDTMYLLNTPSWGTATLNLDGSITYNANEQVCERTDSFQYVVCTPTGCDTANIEVCIECVDIVIFTAVSPNGDGFNDVFYIANIEEYPDNNLKIFNRWGNKVYEMDSYKNQWRGTWNGNRDLPDGTYYYLLELNDEANRVFKGYLEIYR